MEAIPPLPPAVAIHTQHLRDFVAAAPGTVTLEQMQHVVADVIRVLHWLSTMVAEE